MVNSPREINLSNISQVRFILIVLIVLIHCYNIFDKSVFSINSITQDYISQVISRVAVPVYFFISGYLFFTNLDSLKDWKLKVGRRIKTLLVPYLIWNLGYGLLLLFTPNSSIKFSNDINFIENFIQLSKQIFISPAINPFWFIRDLIILQLFSFLYLILKKELRVCLLVLYAGLFLYEYTVPFSFLSSEGILFFSLGALKILPINSFNKEKKWKIILIMIISFLNLLNHLLVLKYEFLLHRICIFSMALLFISLFLNNNSLKINISEKIQNLSFYVFALHFPIIQILNKALHWNHLTGYFLSFFFSLSISLLIGYFLSKFRFISGLLTGNRL